MSVQIPNGRLGVRRVDPDTVDAHGAPLPGTVGALSALLPGKITETEGGTWQLALDPSLWPVRIGDRIVSDEGATWVATNVKLLQTPPLTPEEQMPGLDLDISFVRVTGAQVTDRGTEPADPLLTGRTGYPV